MPPKAFAFMSGKPTTPGKQLEKLLNLVIIGIALKRKQVINFLTKIGDKI